MIPVGYVAKSIPQRPDWLAAPNVVDICSVSDCVNDNIGDYTPDWRPNGYWFFDWPMMIKKTAESNSIDLKDSKLFYYEAYELEFDGDSWTAFAPDSSVETSVAIPPDMKLLGFDAVTCAYGKSPEHSPLSCNSMAAEIPTNTHCLLDGFENAKKLIESGAFKDCEPGPYRIYAVYSVDWPR